MRGTGPVEGSCCHVMLWYLHWVALVPCHGAEMVLGNLPVLFAHCRLVWGVVEMRVRCVVRSTARTKPSSALYRFSNSWSRMKSWFLASISRYTLLASASTSMSRTWGCVVVVHARTRFVVGATYRRLSLWLLQQRSMCHLHGPWQIVGGVLSLCRGIG